MFASENSLTLEPLRPALFALILATGCRPGLLPLDGVVTVDGTPAEEGTSVLFCPVGKTRPATGRVGRDGRFTLQTGGRDGVMAGSYKVTLTNSTNAIEAPRADSYIDVYDPALEKYEANLREFLAKPARLGAIPLSYSSMLSTSLNFRVPQDGREARFEISSGATGK